MAASKSREDELENLIDSLKVPAAFSSSETFAVSEVTPQLDEWKLKTSISLARIKEIVDSGNDGILFNDSVRISASVAVFADDEAWIVAKSRELSTDILYAIGPPPLNALEMILLEHVKPIFKLNPHPMLNTATGRRLPTAAGGPMASQDQYSGQLWKRHPGILSLLLWCIRNAQRDWFERLWHLIIPPIMTLLDDYQSPYKLRGIKVVHEMLERIPKEILARTGVDKLLLTSLATTLTTLHSPYTALIIRAAVPTSLKLVNLVTLPGSNRRFEELSALLGDSIIGNIWIYASMELETVQASIEVIGDIIQDLGIGCARFLKALIPQLIEPLLHGDIKFSRAMQLASVRALNSLIDVCAPRVANWKGAILQAVAKRWLALLESAHKVTATSVDSELADALKLVCVKVAEACPSVVTNEYARLTSLDATVFEALVGGQRFKCSQGIHAEAPSVTAA